MCLLPCQMLGSTHLILYQQMEHYTFPAIPKNIYHIEILFIRTQINYHLEKIPTHTNTDRDIEPECHHLHQIDHV